LTVALIQFQVTRDTTFTCAIGDFSETSSGTTSFSNATAHSRMLSTDLKEMLTKFPSCNNNKPAGNLLFESNFLKPQNLKISEDCIAEK
jgi:hypothetical protein